MTDSPACLCGHSWLTHTQPRTDAWLKILGSNKQTCRACTCNKYTAEQPLPVDKEPADD